MTAQVESRELSLEAADNTRLGNFAGPMEQKLSQIAGIEHVYSVSRPGMAVFTVQFKVGEGRTELRPGEITDRLRLTNPLPAGPAGGEATLGELAGIGIDPGGQAQFVLDLLELVWLAWAGDPGQGPLALPLGRQQHDRQPGVLLPSRDLRARAADSAGLRPTVVW